LAERKKLRELVAVLSLLLSQVVPTFHLRSALSFIRTYPQQRGIFPSNIERRLPVFSAKRYPPQPNHLKF
jgi:hypothetical protein